MNFRYTIICLVAAICASCSCEMPQEGTVSFPPEEEINEYGIPLSRYDTVEGRIAEGDNFSKILALFGVGTSKAFGIAEVADTVFDTRKLRVGGNYHAYLTKGENPQLAYWVYEIDRTSCVVFSMADTLSVDIRRKEVEEKLEMADVTISNSLWYDTQQAGVSPLLALKLSDIFAWTIDFFGLQEGDSYKALYQTIICDGEIIDVGDVKYVLFHHAGKDYEAFFYERGDAPNSNCYWDADGNSTRKAFLKAPLVFKRISSGFSYARRHPVTKKVQPHTGVDYAAPKGTPVVSIGDGTVIEKGYKGAGGNTVKIRHNSTYTTAYLHLSKFGPGIKVGSHVAQGQVIGYVGSTGRSTGPHLDFRIWKNGTPVNPLKMESPAADPLEKKYMDDFKAKRDAVRHQVVYFNADRNFRRKYLVPLGIGKKTE